MPASPAALHDLTAVEIARRVRAREVTAREVTDPVERRRVAEEARRLQPWYAAQPWSVADWVAASPMVVLAPRPPGPT